MWRNYLVTGFRSLTESKSYAFINIFGMALGLAACIFIMLYVRHETSYDEWLPDSNRLYQVQSIYTDPETGESSPQQGTHGAIAAPMANDFPQVEAITRADRAEPVFVVNGEATFAPMVLADEPFFDVLQLPFLRGDPATALKGLDSLVLSRTEAAKRFGGLDILGKTVTAIRRGEQYELRVTGVFEDIPQNSSLNLNMVGRISERDAEECGWGCINGSVYLKLKPGADPEEIHRQMPAWEKRNVPPREVGGTKVSEGEAFDWRLVRISDVHLSGASGGIGRAASDRGTVFTFAVIGLLILAMACVNFVNLATARASHRAREVALRKVLGAKRRQIIMQFMGESALLGCVALLLALTMVELLLPTLSRFLNLNLELRYTGTGGMLLPLLGLLLTVGVLGGLYPALYLSRYQPATVLRANKSVAEPHGTGRLRNVLVVTQFAVSIGLMICTTVIYAQTNFARTTDPGFKREGLMQIGNMSYAAVQDQAETVIQEIKKVAGVTAVAGTDITLGGGPTNVTRVQLPGGSKPVEIGWYSVSGEFFDAMGVRLLAGRKLSRAYANDSSWTPSEPEEAAAAAVGGLVERGINVVVNERAARQMGFATPAEAIGSRVEVDKYAKKAGMLPVTIVGVVQDSHFRSIRERVEPVIFHDRGKYRELVVRYDDANPESVRQNIAQVWKRLAPELPFEADFADDRLADLYLTDGARGQTFAGFALLAVVIACLGLFGLAAFAAQRRTKEIGIRRVFGASVRDIVQLLAWQFTKPVIVANLIAWPVAWWLMRDWLNEFDERIALTPGPFVFAGLLALMIALGTVIGHALRVARTNPIVALRYE